MNPVGYLTNTRQGLKGDRGIGYDYILAANGLFIRAENSLLRATVEVAPADVRGLAPLNESLELVHGRIPFGVAATVLSVAGLDWGHEVYMGVVWKNGAYVPVIPEQWGSAASVKYQRPRGTLLDVHTHGAMSAFFSSTDDADDQGFGLHMVEGRLDLPVHQVALRVSVYGCFASLSWDEVFDHPPPPWLQVVTESPNLAEERR